MAKATHTHTTIPEAASVSEHIDDALERISQITCSSCRIGELNAMRDVLIINAAHITRWCTDETVQALRREGKLPPVEPERMN